MSTVKKPASPAKPPKKAAPKAKAALSHPTWVDMIKECIASHPEDARQGVSRPQIKKFVETKYKLSIGTAQNTQLSKALAAGSEKKIFVLPKGPSGRVKLAPKVKPADASTKENKSTKPKPAAKTAKTATKAAPKAASKKAPAKPTAAAKAKPKTAAAKPKAAAAKPKAAAAKPKLPLPNRPNLQLRKRLQRRSRARRSRQQPKRQQQHPNARLRKRLSRERPRPRKPSLRRPHPRRRPHRQPNPHLPRQKCRGNHLRSVDESISAVFALWSHTIGVAPFASFILFAFYLSIFLFLCNVNYCPRICVCML
ncbi:hypothetical protein B0H12DRAFT_498165 [Mycena haematopus]|nr:hypothetical protein B0H12DRAFT_498165 [Mycena haematopus]